VTGGASIPTPDWLLQPEVGLCPCGCIGHRRKGGFVAKTIEGTNGVLRQALFAEDVAATDGVLQRIEPRVKTITVLGLLAATSLLRHLPILVAMYASTLALAVASGLPLGFFVKRVWLFVPIFTGVIVLPAMFSFITPGHEVVPLGSWFGHRVGITAQGITTAGLIVLRVATSISVVVLLTLTTAWTRLLAALRSLLVPKMFVLVLAMAYRYIFHLLGAVTDMYTARKARTLGPDREGRRFVAAGAGTLFGKSHQLSEEVHQAMVARGYTGNARSLSAFRLRPADAVWSAAVVAAAVLLLVLDRGVLR
jgi:cobalt/nickel transport system permease protein